MSALIPFILSSLPLPLLGEEPLLDSAGFLEACQAHLAPDEFATVLAARLQPDVEPANEADPRPAPRSCDTLRHWREFETYLRNRVAEKRAAALKTEATSYRRDEPAVFPGWKRAIEEALAAHTPLTREKALDKLRWQRLDDLVPGHELDLDALVNYRLRLLLAEKEAAWQAAAGTARLDEWVTTSAAAAAATRTAHDE